MSMEEQHLRELEAIANSLPADPFGMGQLRLLLGSLPAPTQPEVKSAREGAPDVAPGGSGIGQALSLTSTALPGGESSAVLGAAPELYYGQSNLIDNPTLDGILVGVVLSTTLADIAPFWEAGYVLNSGTVGAIQHDGIYARGNSSNPLASAWSDVQIDTSGSNAYNVDVVIAQSSPTNINVVPDGSHVVLACRVWRSIASNLNQTNFPSVYAQVQLVNDSLGTVAAESVPFDLRTFTNQSVKIGCSIPIEDIDFGDSYHWQLVIHAERIAGAFAGFPYLTWGEPQLTVSATQSPPPYTPQLGRWFPQELYVQNKGESNKRLWVGSIDSTEGYVLWGPGTSQEDVRFRRTGVAELTLDSNGVGSGIASLVVGAIETKPFLSVASVNLDADQNNWNPTGLHTVGLLRVSGLTANRTITGLDAGLAEGEMLVLNNDSATFSLILSNDNVASTDVNRFRFAAATSITVRTRGMVLLIYNNNRWRAIAE